MVFDSYLQKLDEAADSRLGNTVSFSANSGLTWADIKAFLQFQAEPDADDFMPIDPVNASTRLKIAKRLLALPDPSRHRFRHPALGASTFRPENWRDAEGGRYWIIDLQKA